MDKPTITPWIEKNLNAPEDFVCFKPFRLNLKDGQGTQSITKGQPVKGLIGNIKKDLYFQNKIMYQKDFEAVTKYEGALKKSDAYQPEVTKESSESSIKNAATSKK